MKLLNYILLSVFILVGISSCTKDDDLTGKGDSGLLSLNVEAVLPKVTRAAVVTNDFVVVIAGKTGSNTASISKQYVVSELPGELRLPVGDYTVSAHSPGEIKKQMDVPYYAGSVDVNIMKNVTSQIEVKCKIKNTKIQVDYSTDFLAHFSEWTITIDDGSKSAISFNQSLSDNPNAVYYYLGEEGSSKLTVNISAKTHDGKRITDSRIITKNQVDGGYQDDNPNFVGGDFLKIMLNLEKQTTGLVNINIEASIIFDNKDEEVDIPVEDGDNGNGNEEGGNTPVDPQPENKDLSIKLPADVEMMSDTSDAPEKADAEITAVKGIQHLSIKIIPGCDAFTEALTAVKETRNIDFLSGEDLVGNEKVESLFNDLKNPLKAPVLGVNQYTFPIANFFGFMINMVGVHQFEITLTDSENNSVSKIFKVTLK